LNKQQQQQQQQQQSTSGFNRDDTMIKNILSDLSKYVSIGMIGMVIGTIMYNNNPDMLASAENVRGGIGYLGIILIFTPLIDKLVTPKTMLFTLLTSIGIGGILISWSFAVQITLAF
jgi:hypothetical protein